MTAAAGIDIARGGQTSGPGSTPGTAQGLGRGAGKAAALAQSSQQGTQSFRSSWQSLLASAGLAGEDTAANTEAALVSDAEAPTNSGGTPFRTSASATNAQAASPLEKPQGAAATGSNPTAVLSWYAQEAVSSGNTLAQAANQIATGVVEKSGAKADGEGTFETRRDYSHKNATKDSANAVTSQAEAPLPTATSTLPGAALAPVILQRAHVAAQDGLASWSDARQAAGSAARVSGRSTPLADTDAGRAHAADGMTGPGKQGTLLSTPTLDRPRDVTGIGTLGTEAAAEGSSKQSTIQAPGHFSLPATSQGTDSASPLEAQAGANLPPVAAGVFSANQTMAGAAYGKTATVEAAGTSGSVRAAGQGATQSVPWKGSRTSAAQATHSSLGQGGTLAQEQPNLTQFRDLSGAHAASDGGGKVSSPSSSAAAPATAVGDTFAALDGDNGSSAAPAWIHASAHQAEAGYQDPALGWVGVRAQVDASGVHAALVPGSVDAAQALGSHLAGLNAYLTEHHTPVDTLTLATPANGWSGQGMGQGLDQGGGQGSGHAAGQGEYSGVTASATASQPDAALTGGRSELSSTSLASGGVYISVMA